MKTIIILVFTFVFANAFNLDYQLGRQRRDLWSEKQIDPGTVFGSVVTPGIGGTQGRLGYGGNLMENKYGRLDGQAYGSRTLGLPDGPRTGYGGNLNWNGNRGSAFLAADHTRGMGTQLDAKATGTIHQFNKNARLDAYGSYSRHYGGPFGASPPNYGVGLNFNWRF